MNIHQQLAERATALYPSFVEELDEAIEFAAHQINLSDADYDVAAVRELVLENQLEYNPAYQKYITAVAEAITNTYRYEDTDRDLFLTGAANVVSMLFKGSLIGSIRRDMLQKCCQLEQAELNLST